MVEYPIGHKRRRKEGMPVLVEKFKTNLARRFPAKQQQAILELCLDAEAPRGDAGQRVRRPDGDLNEPHRDAAAARLAMLQAAPHPACAIRNPMQAGTWELTRSGGMAADRIGVLHRRSRHRGIRYRR